MQLHYEAHVTWNFKMQIFRKQKKSVYSVFDFTQIKELIEY